MFTAKNTSPIGFFNFSILCMVTLLSSYFLSIEFWLTSADNQQLNSYTEFLLKNTPSPRIIIDSGSNSLYSINPLDIEKTFNVPAINIADNINYSINHKFNYLSKHAQKGDIIIIPLEWRNYQNKEGYYAEYIAALLRGELNHYYHSLAISERINFVFTGIPINTYLDRIIRYHPRKSSIDRLIKHKALLAKNNGESLGAKLPTKRADKINFMGGLCDDAILHHFNVSETFKTDLMRLSDVEKNGATVIFTWPAVVDFDGDTCYKTEHARRILPILVGEIKSIINKAGYKIIGEPQDSAFSSKYFFDSFYHLTAAGNKIRTERLIKRMQEYGIAPNKDSNYSASDSIKILSRKVEELIQKNTH